jgi:hypothetical protein
MYFKSKEVSVEKVVHLFDIFTTIFFFSKFLELGKVNFGMVAGRLSHLAQRAKWATSSRAP